MGCNDNEMLPEAWQSCRSVVTWGWAVGSEGDMLPDDVGLPMCERFGGATYFMLEIHYDNPKLHKGVVDQSGLRIFYTDKLRKQEGGMLLVGTVPDETMQIPPNRDSFLTSAFCTGECTQNVSSKVDIVP